MTVRRKLAELRSQHAELKAKRDTLARDVPARHPKHADCLISVRRKNSID